MRAWLVVVASLGTGVAHAAPEPDPPKSSAGQTFVASLVTGRIAAVDPEKARVAIEEGGKKTELVLDDRATVFLEGRLGAPKDLAPGQAVRLAWEERDGKKAVRWIEVLPAPTRRLRADGATAAQVSGTVVRVKKRELVLRQGSAEWSLSLADGAQVVIQGAPAGLEALAPGEEVKASFDPGAPGTLRIDRVSAPKQAM